MRPRDTIINQLKQREKEVIQLSNKNEKLTRKLEALEFRYAELQSDLIAAREREGAAIRLMSEIALDRTSAEQRRLFAQVELERVQTEAEFAQDQLRETVFNRLVAQNPDDEAPSETPNREERMGQSGTAEERQAEGSETSESVTTVETTTVVESTDAQTENTDATPSNTEAVPNDDAEDDE